ncbi:MAG: A/G-specific adenine glycosylase [Terrimicrobiaceae bacterium]|nr:A/G-specific adenine glycosylase [Terrimicrobiaceae bacterium]
MIPRANQFRTALGRWFEAHGRRGLPWRGNPDPYAVLVSEFMLQQTTVAAVIPYFQRWMRTFPNPGALASAPEERVLKLWEGLGYYSRARNLQRAAVAIVRDHGGRVPADPDRLRSLPGVGPYTAAAVAAFAFDQPVVVLDANISRVIARLDDLRMPIDSAGGKARLAEVAGGLLPESGGAAHTAALMDLGATICRAGEPLCNECPVRKWCRAENPAELPVKRPKSSFISEEEFRVLARRRDRVFLIESPGPRWRGLWILPPGRPPGDPVVELDYVVTRHKIHLEVRRSEPQAGWTGFPLQDLPAMPTAHRKAVWIAAGRAY